MILSILICTLPERQDMFKKLINELKAQVRTLNCFDKVECVYNDKPKGSLTIGAKRNELLNSAKGEYVVYIDDDDSVPTDYIKEVLKALESKPDCVGYYENVVFDGRKERSLLSIKCEEWKAFNEPFEGVNYYRTPFAKTPIKTELCKQVMYNDMNFGEDIDFSKRIYPLLKKEVFINKDMYYYTFTSGQSIIERYGS